MDGVDDYDKSGSTRSQEEPPAEKEIVGDQLVLSGAIGQTLNNWPHVAIGQERERHIKRARGFGELAAAMCAGANRVFGSACESDRCAMAVAAQCLEDGDPVDLNMLAAFVQEFFDSTNIKPVRGDDQLRQSLCKLLVTSFEKDERWTEFVELNEKQHPF
jgi:hypothetical protein